MTRYNIISLSSPSMARRYDRKNQRFFSLWKRRSCAYVERQNTREPVWIVIFMIINLHRILSVSGCVVRVAISIHNSPSSTFWVCVCERYRSHKYTSTYDTYAFGGSFIYSTSMTRDILPRCRCLLRQATLKTFVCLCGKEWEIERGRVWENPNDFRKMKRS